MVEVDILMACYNGGRYFTEQIDSIIAQTFSNWRLLIRDDGSTDGTRELIISYCEKYPDKIVLVEDGLGNLGARGNFDRLFELSNSPYCSFSDQDDIWMPYKLENALNKMKELESQFPHTPVLVFADRKIVDEHGDVITESYWRRQNLHPNRFDDFFTIASKCVAAGSTMLINRQLREESLPIPAEAKMHDTWIELVAAGLGKWEFIDEIALSYRRHDNNVSGGQQTFKESRGYFARFIKLLNNLKMQKKVYEINFSQAKVFNERYSEKLNPSFRKKLELFLELHRLNIFSRAMRVVCNKSFGPPGWERKVSFVILSKVD